MRKNILEIDLILIFYIEKKSNYHSISKVDNIIKFINKVIDFYNYLL